MPPAVVHTVVADVHIGAGGDSARDQARARVDEGNRAHAASETEQRKDPSSLDTNRGGGSSGATQQRSRQSFLAQQKLKQARSVSLDSSARRRQAMCKSSSLLRLDLHLPEPDKLKKMEQEGDLRVRPTIHVASKRETLKEYFNSLDEDGSGEVELDEMLAWLPKIGMGSQAQQDQVRDHFRFMDRDGSGQVDFEEFAEATIDVADHDVTSLADEKYIKHFGMEIYMFLASLKRHKLIHEYETQLKHRDDQLAPFLKFEQLMKISQAATMPLEMVRQATPPPDPALAKARREGRLRSMRSKGMKSASDPEALSMMSPGQRTERDAEIKRKRRAAINKKRAAICAKVAAKRSHSYDRWQPAAIAKKKYHNADKSDRRDARLSYVNKQDRDFSDSIETLMLRSDHDLRNERLVALRGTGTGKSNQTSASFGFSDEGGYDGTRTAHLPGTGEAEPKGPVGGVRFLPRIR